LFFSLCEPSTLSVNWKRRLFLHQTDLQLHTQRFALDNSFQENIIAPITACGHWSCAQDGTIGTVADGRHYDKPLYGACALVEDLLSMTLKKCLLPLSICLIMIRILFLFSKRVNVHECINDDALFLFGPE